MLNGNFPDNQEHAILVKRILVRTKTDQENLQQYYFAKRSLLQPCNFTAAEEVLYIIDGIKNQTIQLEAKARYLLLPKRLYSEYIMQLTDEEDVAVQDTQTSGAIRQSDLPQSSALYKPRTSHDTKTPMNRAKLETKLQTNGCLIVKEKRTCLRLQHISEVGFELTPTDVDCDSIPFGLTVTLFISEF